MNDPLGPCRVDLSKVQSFIYQLQNINLSAIGRTSFDLVIIDYSSDGSISGEYPADSIDALKHSVGNEKIVLAYMSIGEAEDYRFYWQPNWKPGNPSWLGLENPEWPGNFSVKYWDPDWQSIMIDYANRILHAGFDGVYLDLVDAYETFADAGRVVAAQEMVDFIQRIASGVRDFNPDFLIFVQNASELVNLVPDYPSLIDGIGQESLYFGYGDDGEATPPEVIAGLEANLSKFKNIGKVVLTIDYPFSGSKEFPHFDVPTRVKIDAAYSRASANGYIPFCTVRNLSYLTVNPGHEPAGIEPDNSDQPIIGFRLFQNYPNPFNSETTIPYSIAGFRSSVRGTLKIFDLLGREIGSLVDAEVKSGDHSFLWKGIDGSGNPVPSGVYLVQLKAENSIRLKSILMIR